MKQDHNTTIPTTDPVALNAFYEDRKLMWRNVRWVLTGNFGGAICLSIITPLMNLRLQEVGVSQSGIGMIASINLWAISILVMYFAWKSDHRVSKWGRRIPYLLLSLPFIVTTVILFPCINHPWILVGLMLVHLYFLDMKNSTYPLLTIDCVPRPMLARINALNASILGLSSFLAIRYGSKLADTNEYLPYLIGGTILTVASFLAAFRIKEPPIFNPTQERFTPFSTMKVAWQDRRVVVAMVAIALLQSFAMMSGTWMWFFAKETLGLTRTETGAAISWSALLAIAISYPAGWLIDRVGSYKVLVVYWIFMAAAFVTITQITSAMGLTILMFLMAMMGPLYCAGDMILWKQMNPNDVGSVTSTIAFVRNAYSGLLIFLSGYIIEWTGGNYVVVFAMGFGLATLSLGIFLVYRELMKKSYPTAQAELLSAPESFAVNADTK